MPKKFFLRYMPDHKTVREHQSLQMFGRLLYEPNLWHLNRRSVSGATAVGLFWAFIPMPFQMIPAAAGAILFRTNLPLAVAWVWISNPLTMPPLFYFNYVVGETLLGMEPLPLKFEFSTEWLVRELAHIWQPLYLGSVVVAIVMSVIGYFTIRGLWRLHIVSHYRKRRERRARSKEESS